MAGKGGPYKAQLAARDLAIPSLICTATAIQQEQRYELILRLHA